MLRAITRLGSFFGRASQREFALVFIPTLCLSFAQTVIVMIWPELTHQQGEVIVSLGLSMLIGWALLAVSVRRLHDLDKSGWLLLLWIVPMVGVVILVWMFARSVHQVRTGLAPRSD